VAGEEDEDFRRVVHPAREPAVPAEEPMQLTERDLFVQEQLDPSGRNPQRVFEVPRRRASVLGRVSGRRGLQVGLDTQHHRERIGSRAGRVRNEAVDVRGQWHRRWGQGANRLGVRLDADDPGDGGTFRKR